MVEIQDDVKKKLRKLVKDEKYRHELYAAAKEHFEEMSWHVYGKKPEKLLKRVRPREDPAIRDYRLESYEPITKSYCKKAISICHKVFNPKLYSIRFDQNNDKAALLKKYTLSEYPRFNSIINYFSGYVLKKMIADPNGILLAQPYNYYLVENERVMPFLTCYNSEQIYYIDDEYVILLDEYENGNREWEFTLVDKVTITKLEIKATNQNDYVFEIKAQYIHNFGELPIWNLGGEYSDDQYGLLESYFYDAVPFWNEAINDHSDVNGNYRMHINSQRWEIADECEYVDQTDNGNYACNDGYIFNSSEGKKYKCPGCGGTGYKKTATGPYDVYQVQKEKVFADGSELQLPPFGYVAPPVEGLKMLEDRVRKSLEQGLSAINMDVVNKIGENQSGISKEIDRTELNSFLQKIADQFFDIHLPNTYYFFVRYMFGIEVKSPEELRKIEPEISKPQDFDILSTTEMMEQLEKAKSAKINPSFLQAKQIELQNREFNTHPELLNQVNLELILDPLAEITRDEVSLMLANKTITQETAIIHDNISVFVRRAMIENQKFPTLKYPEQVAILNKYAQEVIEATKVKLDTTMFDESGGSIETPVDVEAEAKAKLKGSVGGVQGLIQIQQSVAAGITDYEAAVTMLFEIYGFEDSIARKLLGDKNDLENSKIDDSGATEQ